MRGVGDKPPKFCAEFALRCRGDLRAGYGERLVGISISEQDKYGSSETRLKNASIRGTDLSDDPSDSQGFHIGINADLHRGRDGVIAVDEGGQNGFETTAVQDILAVRARRPASLAKESWRSSKERKRSA